MNEVRIRRIERLLGHSKWVAVICVITLYLTSILIILIGILNFIYILKDIIIQLQMNERIDVLLFSGRVITIIEAFIQAVIFYILAVGIHKLFIGRIRILNWYHVESLEDMKSDLAKTIVIFLAVFLVQKIVEWKDVQKILSMGLVIGGLSSILIWYIMTLARKKIMDKNYLSGKRAKE